MLLAALLVAAAPVEVQRPHDEPPTLALSWSTAGASACPSRAELIERIAAQGVGGQLGERVPVRHREARLAVEVEVEVVGDRWRASLSLSDADGHAQRSFSAESCAALADATALIVAVTLDPIAVASLHASVAAGGELAPAEPEPEPVELEPVELEPVELEPSPSPASNDPPIDLTLPSSADEDQPSPSWPEDLQLGVSIHGGGGWGPTSAGSASLGGRLALLGARWRAELGARWALPRRLERDGAAGVFDAWVVEGRGCFSPGVRTLEFPLCPGIEAGSMRGRGVPPTRDLTRQNFWWVAPSLSQGLTWAPVRRFAIGVELGLVVPLTRGRFVVGERPVTELAVIGGRALLNLELRLP
ncbi:MAG: hypothetical protein R6X02_35475 [Enhygromyxa sp.]